MTTTRVFLLRQVPWLSISQIQIRSRNTRRRIMSELQAHMLLQPLHSANSMFWLPGAYPCRLDKAPGVIFPACLLFVSRHSENVSKNTQDLAYDSCDCRSVLIYSYLSQLKHYGLRQRHTLAILLHEIDFECEREQIIKQKKSFISFGQHGYNLRCN